MKWLPVTPDRWTELEHLFESRGGPQALLVHGVPTDAVCVSSGRIYCQEGGVVGDGCRRYSGRHLGIRRL